MKQIIVMIAMVLLGVAIAGFVVEFKGSAQTISNKAKDEVLTVTTSGAI